MLPLRWDPTVNFLGLLTFVGLLFTIMGLIFTGIGIRQNTYQAKGAPQRPHRDARWLVGTLRPTAPIKAKV
jgi:hypothetical protein